MNVRICAVSFVAIVLGLLLCAQTPMLPGFPPGVFSNRAPLDAAVAYQGPGDVVAFGAWGGVRAYSSAKRGNVAVNVCNLADVACADLSTDATTGDLTVGLIGGSSCAVVTCTVKTLYDQTGNTNCTTACDWTRAVIADRPTLVVNCVNGKACLNLSGNQGLISPALAATSSQPNSMSAVAQRNSGTVFEAIIVNSAGTCGIIFNNAANGVRPYCPSLPTAISATDGVWHALQEVFNGTSGAMMVDSVDVTGINSGTTSLSSTLFVGTNVVGSLDIRTTEVGVILGTAITSGNRTSLDSNQRTYYNF